MSKNDSNHLRHKAVVEYLLDECVCVLHHFVQHCDIWTSALIDMDKDVFILS